MLATKKYAICSKTLSNYGLFVLFLSSVWPLKMITISSYGFHALVDTAKQVARRDASTEPNASSAITPDSHR